MGAYLSCPITELLSEDGESLNLSYGSASMQGWRVSQEDAHIALIDYDTNTSLFGVFDGHGGHEVAKYCAQHLPDFIKSLNSYKNNDMSEVLEEAFLQFDSTLIKPEVVNELKILAGTEELDKEIDDDDINEAILLREEADIPIADLMARYNSNATFVDENEVECTSSSNIKMRIPLPSHMRNEMSVKNSQKPLSPYLRARNNRRLANHENEDNSQICSSSSGSSSSSTCTKTGENISNSETNSGSLPDSTNKIDSEINVSLNESIIKDNETNECNESKESISNGEILSTNEDKSLISSTDCLPTSSITDSDVLHNDDNQITTSENTNNNKSENNSSNCVTNADTSNSIDEQTSGLVSDKGKGKQKKVITPKRVSTTSSTILDDDEVAEPIYKSFLDDFDDSEDDSNDDFSAELSSDDDEDDDDVEDEESSEDEELDDEDSGLVVQSSGYEEPGRDSGCTAVVALLKDNKLYVANAGDSRCVLSRNRKAIEMSYDHKPEDDIERNRVEKAGGKVTPDGRVNGGLNLSRAIGDHAYKDNPNISDREQMITALPDVKSITLEFPNDEFMVIACDGIWNSLSSQQVIDFVGERIDEVQKLSTICDDLFKHCLAPNTLGDGTGCDNMTCIIVKFANTSSKRKLEDEECEGIESNAKQVVSKESEPDPKRIKTDICENDSEVTESEIKV